MGSFFAESSLGVGWRCWDFLFWR